MQTKDIPCRRKKQRVIRLEVEYAPTSEIRAAHALAILVDLLEEAIVKRRKEQRGGESGDVPSPIKGGSLYLEGNTEKDK
ncbi:MAG: hypothetical protein HY921_10135 [Elusimicrobia bacterium]|nr:hypothetical protein [Elusimicrobiota bacterium]